MMFKRVLFGYSRAEVDAYIRRMSDALAKKDAVIDNLKHKIRQLEYANDELQIRISIYEELRKWSGRSALVEESPGCDSITKKDKGACSHE